MIGNGNIFEELVRAVRVCSLGQITKALFEVGGQYRRSMYPLRRYGQGPERGLMPIRIPKP